MNEFDFLRNKKNISTNITHLRESKNWNADRFDSAEKVGEELKRLHDEKEKHLKADDMPSMYFENIDRHIEELNQKMSSFDCKRKNLQERMISSREPIFAKKNINIWGKQFNLTIIYDSLNDSEELKKDLEIFLSTNLIDKSKNRFISYCKNYIKIHNIPKTELESIDFKNIFTFVNPGSLIVKKNSFFLVCGFKFSKDNIGIGFSRNSIGSVIMLDQKILMESRLPSDPSVDPQYGVPEQKKYPLFDKAHVESAIRLFGHVEPKYERQLARAIISKMRKYNIPYDQVGEENRLYRYIPDSFKNK